VAREGIAIDSSAYNIIDNNVFYKNKRGGVFLYKNAYEKSWGTAPRVQHSDANTIVNNLFVDEPTGVFVASRASREYLYRHGDAVYLDLGGPDTKQGLISERPIEWKDYLTGEGKFHRDYAGSTRIEDNTFIGTRIAAIRISDDLARVEWNYFLEPEESSDAIILGNDVRDEALEPIYGLTLQYNEFDSAYYETGQLINQSHPAKFGDPGGGCVLGSFIRDNVLINSGTRSLELDITCEAGFAPRLHYSILPALM